MKSFRVALQFLTRLPAGPSVIWDERVITRSVAYYPLIGLIIGILLWALYWLFNFLFSPAVVAALLIMGEILITGGLHWDGFMDTMDGVFSGRERERALEIMKDSRVGAFGVIGAIGLFILKYNLFIQLLPSHWMVALLCMPVVARVNLLPTLRYFPPARPSGLGKIFAEKKDGIYQGLGGLFGIILLGVAGGWAGLFIGALVIIIGWWLNRWFVSLLGGLTGDTYGALVEISEVVFLLGLQALQNLRIA